MWTFVALTCLVAVCSAQTPPRPNISETFDSSGPAEVHRGVTIFGTVEIARDQVTGEGLEKFMFKDPQGKNETYENLERYDLHEEFKIRIIDTKETCQLEKTQGSLPPFWRWVKDADYAGKKTVKHKTYDLWVLHVAGVRLEVGVLEDSPNVPYYFARQESSQFIAVELTTFNPATPPSSKFVIPPQCKTGHTTPMTLLTRAKTL